MILVTGFNGFVGSSLLQLFKSIEGVSARGTSRLKPDQSEKEIIYSGEIHRDTSWHNALKGCDTVIHTAALTHQMNTDLNKESIEMYREINTLGTINLAKQAAKMGIKRFIFLSSIKVNGESTYNGQPFTADDKPNPLDNYAISKYEAEIGLKEISKNTDMEVVIIRPSLIYGVGVKANFEALIKFINKGFPLPFASIKNNKRSFVSLDNLNDLIIKCIDHPDAANQIFLVSDGSSLSTRELVEKIAEAMSKKIKLINIPISLLYLVAKLLGKEDAIIRLTGSLEVDITKTNDVLGWFPPFTVNEGLQRACVNFNNEKIIK
jgi:UDP-glucose 4-epimerase